MELNKQIVSLEAEYNDICNRMKEPNLSDDSYRALLKNKNALDADIQAAKIKRDKANPNPINPLSHFDFVGLEIEYLNTELKIKKLEASNQSESSKWFQVNELKNTLQSIKDEMAKRTEHLLK